MGGSGNPSPYTAVGTFEGIRACAIEVWGSDDLKGKVVALQGPGNVGYPLCEQLAKAGARLIVADVSQDNVDRCVRNLGAEAVPPDRIFDQACDIFSPNALGAVLNDQTIPRLKCKVVCGGANNQLATPGVASLLAKRDVLYCPDYCVNAGGVIQVADEIDGFNFERAKLRATKIFDTTKRILELAAAEGISPATAADRLAEQRMAEVGRLSTIRL